MAFTGSLIFFNLQPGRETAGVLHFIEELHELGEAVIIMDEHAPNANIKMDCVTGALTFEDGTIELDESTNTFDVSGTRSTFNYRMIQGTGVNGWCHDVYFEQDGERVSK